MSFFLIVMTALALVLVLATNILYLLAKLLSLVFHFHLAYWPFAAGLLAVVAVGCVLVVYGNRVGRFKVRTNELGLQFDGLPKSLDGFRIVHISDIHLGSWAKHPHKLEDLVHRIVSLDPDAIAFTGDLVAMSEEEFAPFAHILSQLKAKEGVFSVLGNHDYLPYLDDLDDEEKERRKDKLVEMEREIGWTVLLNSHALVRRGGDSLAIIGCENQSLGVHNVVMRGDLGAATEGTDGLFRILLTHDPTHWRAEVLGKTDIPLTLSGHTHGGQARILGFNLSRLFYKEDAGLYEEAGQRLYVNTGLGSTIPSRIGVPPEITLIELRRK